VNTNSAAEFGNKVQSCGTEDKYYYSSVKSKNFKAVNKKNKTNDSVTQAKQESDCQRPNERLKSSVS